MITKRQTELLYRLIGRRVLQRRKERRFSQEELADLIAVSRTSITNLEHGRQRIPLHQLAGVADALGCELVDLLPTLKDLSPAPERKGAAVELQDVRKLTPATRSVIERSSVTRSVIELYTAGGSDDESSQSS